MKEAACDEKKIGDEKTVVRKVIYPVMIKIDKKAETKYRENKIYLLFLLKYSC